MSFKPLIFLFFAWLVWGGLIAQSVLSQNKKNLAEVTELQFNSEGQMLDWFFQERTLQIKSLKDDEPEISRYSLDEWKAVQPWKGVVFLKNGDSHLYGVFDKVMPEAHRKQLLDKIIQLKPTTRFEGVFWEAFQWNGTPFILGYINRSYGLQAFIAQGEDWGRTLSLIPSESSWLISNQSGKILFHPDIRYVGQKKPEGKNISEKEKSLVSTNLTASMSLNSKNSSRSLIYQVILMTLGLALISSVWLNQFFKKEKISTDNKIALLRNQISTEISQGEKNKEPAYEGPLVSQEHLLKDLSQRVSTSIGRQLEPSLLNILSQAQWLLSLNSTQKENLNQEEVKALEIITREVRSSKSSLEKLLAVAGERKLDLFPMKIETPVLRALKRWQVEFESQEIVIEKHLNETSFFPMNSEALEKSLSHLIQNSLEAMSRQLEKKISIQIKDDLQYLYLTFEDNGIGIEPHHLNIIADAFFTTKPQSRHLGLGLTEAFGIFKQHHAIVKVVSEVGKFTRFEIQFDKNEAMKLIDKQEALKNRAFDGQIITIPDNLPLPLNMHDSVQFEENKESEKKKLESELHQVTVDEEIDKLLELSEIEFIQTQIETDSPKTEIEEIPQDFIDFNPDLGALVTDDTEKDDFKLKYTSRRELDA
jgi:signal transduction histidine kinase